MASPPPSKKAKTEDTYLMNINDAVDKAWEGKALTEIAQAPISAIQGLAKWTDEEFAKLGLSSIYELGTWKYFLWARAFCKLADTEAEGKRERVSRMNVNKALDKAHEGKHLNEVLQLPPSALQGLAEWVDEVFAKLHIKTIQQFGTWKFAEWANAIAVLTPLEIELPPVEFTKKPRAKPATAPKAPKASPDATSDAPAESAALASTKDAPIAPDVEADPAAIAMAKSCGWDDVTVTAHFKLANVDIATNTDKFFVMQTLTCGDKFLFASRWGRTGSRGQAKVEGPLDTADEAAEMLAAKFEEKTDNAVETVADGTFAHVAGKYDLVEGDDGATRSTVGANGGCLWQYYVDDGVDGKTPGWYDYAKDAAEIVEGVYGDWKKNPSRGLSVRSVQSDTFCYHVNFDEMTQTNVTHRNRKRRTIRRNA